MPVRHARLMRRLHQLLPAVNVESNAELLGRYVRDRDEAAFAALVHRHGSMVLGVCARIAGDFHAAEDAFQATFLALARQADSIRRPAALAAWLYSTAQRIARNARGAAVRRAPALLSGDALADPRPDPLSQLSARELLTILDEEVQRLPEANRVAVILCCLDGKTLEEGAHELGCTIGSLRGRLDRGRARLHAQLTRRGLTATAALAAAEVARGTASAGLIANTTQAALAFARTGAATAQVSAETVRLAVEVLGGSTAKAKLGAALLLVLGLTAFGAVALTQPSLDKPPPQAKHGDEPAPKVAAKEHVDRLGDALPPEAVARIGSSRLRTGGRLIGLAYSADGKTIISAIDRSVINNALEDSLIQFWDAETGKLRHSVPARIALNSAFVVPDDGKVLHLFTDNTYQALDPSSGKELRRITLTKDPGQRMQLNSAGTAVAVASLGGGVRLYELPSGVAKQNWKVEGVNYSFAFTPDGKTLAVGTYSGLVHLFDTTTGEIRGQVKTSVKRLSHIQISPDGGTLITAGLIPGPLFVWDLHAGKERCRIDGEAGEMNVYCTLFSRDSRYLIIGGQGKHIVVCDVATGKETRRFLNAGTCQRLALSRDGKTLLAGDGLGISQWDVATGKLLPASADPIGGVGPIRFVDGAKHLLTVREAHVVYDWKTGLEVHRYAEAPGVNSFWSSLSADGKRLASAAEDGKSVVVLDAKTGKLLRTFAGYELFVRQTLLSPDGQTLFSSGTDQTVRIWDVETAKQLHELKGHIGAPAMVLSPDGQWLATVGSAREDPDVRIWNVATGQLSGRIAPKRGSVHTVAFSRSGTELVVAGGTWGASDSFGDVGLFSVPKGGEVKAFIGHAQAVTGVAVSPDGRMLATSGMDKTLRLWEIASGLERHRFEGTNVRSEMPQFSPDNTLLAAYCAEHSLLLWDVYGKHASAPQSPAPISADASQRIWQDLASADARAAFQAVRRLISSPDAAIALLRDRLKPSEPVDAKRLKGWLHDLDSEDFDARQAASAELDKLGTRIEAPLSNALAHAPPLETKRRIEAILAKVKSSPERLRQSRAIEALELIATAEAVQMLRNLSGGESGARLTHEAAQALDRLSNRSSPR